MKPIHSLLAPKAVGPFSQAMQIGDLIFCSGQIGIDPVTDKMRGNSLESQTMQIFKNIAGLLSSKGLGLSNIVKTTVYLTDMKDFKYMNELYEKEMNGHKPARTTISVKELPLGAVIEIESIVFSKT